MSIPSTLLILVTGVESKSDVDLPRVDIFIYSSFSFRFSTHVVAFPAISLAWFLGACLFRFP